MDAVAAAAASCMGLVLQFRNWDPSGALGLMIVVDCGRTLYTSKMFALAALTYVYYMLPLVESASSSVRMEPLCAREHPLRVFLLVYYT